MSKELIERLRADAESTDDIGLCADAADRIEQLEAERDELTACLNLIYSWSNNWDSEFMDESRDYPVTYDEVITALITTPEQSLAEYRNKVIEECAAVLNVAITRLSSCGASIKNDVAISTLKEQSCRLRAMKEQP